ARAQHLARGPCSMHGPTCGLTSSRGPRDRVQSDSVMKKVLGRLVDLREGEGVTVLQAFVTLFGLIAAHTMLETARDALFLGRLPSSRLTFVYVLLSGLALVVSSYNERFVRRFGRRNALVFTLMLCAYGTTVLHFLPQSATVVFALYVWSGLLGTVLV